MKKAIFGLAALMSAVVLVACGGGGTDTFGDNSGGNSNNKEGLTFPVVTKSNGDAIEDGELGATVAMDSQFKGLFQWGFYRGSFNVALAALSHEALSVSNDDFRITGDGAATLDLDQDMKKATIKIKDNVKWLDGEDVAADDVIFSYETVGYKDHTGIRYDDTFRNIVGIEEYHDGSADTTFDIKKVDDKTVEIEYKDVNSSMLQAGGGIWSYVALKHTLEGTATKDMESSDQVCKNPVTFGPYYMSNTVVGESAEYLPNEHYWNGTPKLKKITMKFVPTAGVTEILNSKLYDTIFQMSTDTYDMYREISGYTNLGRE